MPTETRTPVRPATLVRGSFPSAAASVALVALCATTSSCSNAEQSDNDVSSTPVTSVSLQLPSQLWPAISGLPAPTVHEPISIGAGTIVCLSGPGTATVVEVRAVDASSGFAIEGFSVRPNPFLEGNDQLGEMPGTLSEAGFDPDDNEVDMACDGEGAGYEVGIQLARTGEGPATSRGFQVAWESGEETGVLTIPLAVVLCDGPTAFPKRCDTGPLLR